MSKRVGTVERKRLGQIKKKKRKVVSHENECYSSDSDNSKSLGYNLDLSNLRNVPHAPNNELSNGEENERRPNENFNSTSKNDDSSDLEEVYRSDNEADDEKNTDTEMEETQTDTQTNSESRQKNSVNKNGKGKNYTPEEIKEIIDLYIKHRNWNIGTKMEQMFFAKRDSVSYKRKISALVTKYLKKQRECDEKIKVNDNVVLMLSNKSVAIAKLKRIGFDKNKNNKINNENYGDDVCKVMVKGLYDDCSGNEKLQIKSLGRTKFNQVMHSHIPYYYKDIRYYVEEDCIELNAIVKYYEYVEKPMILSSSSASSSLEMNKNIYEKNKEQASTVYNENITRNRAINTLQNNSILHHTNQIKNYSELSFNYFDLLDVAKSNLLEVRSIYSSQDRYVYTLNFEDKCIRSDVNNFELLKNEIVSRFKIYDFTITYQYQQQAILVENENDFKLIPKKSKLNINKK
jgi:hypothetical protein